MLFNRKSQFLLLVLWVLLFSGAAFASTDTLTAEAAADSCLPGTCLKRIFPERSNHHIKDYFFDLECFLIKDRIRYDSVHFGGTTAIGASIAADNVWDVPLGNNDVVLRPVNC